MSGRLTVEADPGQQTWALPYGAEIDDTLVAIDVLGGGTRYEVYRAWDRVLFCQVAVKVVRPHRVSEDRVLDGLQREIAIASRLQHPNLVRLLRWSMAPPRPYMVFEHIAARTVAAHLDDIGPVSVPECCLLGIRMLSALHYLHTNHVLHLDVKPDNVTMGDPPRLLDLSLAQTFSTPVKLRHAVGTTAYMPPEQCEHGDVSPQSDLFGIGVTIYEALSGMQPFSIGDETATERALRYPQLVEDPQPLGDLIEVHPLLERVVMSCLARDPASRPRSAIDVSLVLQSVLESLRTDDLYGWPPGLAVRPRKTAE